jgi:hypothetical protein
MGLTATGSPGLQDQVARFQPEIMRALANAATLTRNGSAAAMCDLWFGDSAGPFMGRLSRGLGKFRSIINTQQINVVFAPLGEREKYENAAAYYPAGGWGEHLDFANAGKQGFTMHLNEGFNSLPIYCVPDPQTASGQSKFETIVHELSHLILGTDDEVHAGQTAYGADAARDLAKASPHKAKNNAENWGLFVESFR